MEFDPFLYIVYELILFALAVGVWAFMAAGAVYYMVKRVIADPGPMLSTRPWRGDRPLQEDTLRRYGSPHSVDCDGDGHDR